MGDVAQARGLGHPEGVVLTGKALVAYLLQFVQVLAVLVLGALAFGYRPKGSVIALLLAVLAFSAVLAALGVAIALWAPSQELALSLSNIIGMLAAGIGGAFCTVSSLPDWAQRAARFSRVLGDRRHPLGEPGRRGRRRCPPGRRSPRAVLRRPGRAGDGALGREEGLRARPWDST